jgi:hypothetical protein
MMSAREPCPCDAAPEIAVAESAYSRLSELVKHELFVVWTWRHYLGQENRDNNKYASYLDCALSYTSRKDQLQICK